MKRAGGSVIDAAVWREPPPGLVEVDAERERARVAGRSYRRLRRFVIAVMVLVIAALAWSRWSNWPPFGSGDPGAKIQNALLGIRGAVPAGATGVTILSSNSQWRWPWNCGDEYRRSGWTDPTATVVFHSVLQRRTVDASAAAGLRDRGWRPVVRPRGTQPGSLAWIRPVSGGGQAHATLSPPPPSSDVWVFRAEAESVAPVARCAGG